MAKQDFPLFPKMRANGNRKKEKTTKKAKSKSAPKPEKTKFLIIVRHMARTTSAFSIKQAEKQSAIVENRRKWGNHEHDEDYVEGIETYEIVNKLGSDCRFVVLISAKSEHYYNYFFLFGNNEEQAKRYFERNCGRLESNELPRFIIVRVP